MRHTSITLDLIAGTHPKVVAERVGHSSTKLTLDRYAHVVKGMQREAADRLDDLLANAGDENVTKTREAVSEA